MNNHLQNFKTKWSFAAFFSAILWLVFSFESKGQSFHFTNWKSTDGLPSNYINAIYEDHLGFLWMGTFSGVSRFNGNSFINYGLANGLPSNRSDCIYEDSHHKIWIGTRRGLVCFDGKKMTTYPPIDTTISSYFHTIEERENGTMRCIINSQLYDLVDGHFKKLRFLSDTTRTIERRFRLSNGRLLYYGRTKDNKEKGRFYTPNGETKLDSVFCPYKEMNGQPIQSNAFPNLFYFPCKDGLYSYDFEKHTATLLDTFHFDGYIVNGCLADSKGRVWIGLESTGLYLFQNGKSSIIGKNMDYPELITPVIFEDRNKQVWLGNFNGLLKANEISVKWYTTPFLQTSDVRYTKACNDGKVYFALNKLHYLYAENGELKEPSPEIKKFFHDRNSYSRITGFSTDDKNRLWIGTYSGRLYQNDKNVMTDVSEKYGIQTYYEQELLYDPTTKITFVPLEKGFLLVRADTVVQKVTTDENGKEIGYISRMKKDCRGNIWLDERNHLWLFDYKRIYDVSVGLGISYVFPSLEESRGDTVWIGTQGLGLLKYYWKNNQLKKDEAIDVESGLPNNHIYDAIIDQTNHMWILTAAGLCRLDLNNKSTFGKYFIRQFKTADGMPATNFNFANMAMDTLGNIWCSNYEGIVKVEANKIRTSPFKPKVFIENVNLIREGVPMEQLFDLDSSFFHIPQDPSFAYNQNDIAITLGGINLFNGYLRYAYRLEGLENDSWHYTLNNDVITYYNLAAGKYNFQAKALNDDGLESDIVSFKFEINPPFWQTWWFRTLFAIVVTVAIYYFIKQREKSIQKQNDLALQMSELKLTALQSQMNPHFIFNSLNSIQNYIMQQKPIDAARYLSKFSKLIRRILDHSFNHLEPLSDIVDTIRMYVELEAFRFSNEFSYHIELQDEDEIGKVELPPMLLQPFVENAILHGLMPKEGLKQLDLIMQLKNGKVLISIEDNGVGRKQEVEKRPGHISRAQKIVNDMLVTMRSLQGVEPQITFVDKTDPDGNAAGTRVEITVPIKNF